MKRCNAVQFGVLAITLIATGSLAVAEEGEGSRFDFVLGPRVGLTLAVTKPEDFNASVQHVYPDSGRSYFPLITQFGLNLEQRIRLGSTRSHFAFQEVVLVGGIDQNVLMPSLSTLIGFRSHSGLEIGLGPNMSMTVKDGEPVLSMSVVFAAGWTFSFDGVYVPVNLAVVPTPQDGAPRITFVTGFNFGLFRS